MPGRESDGGMCRGTIPASFFGPFVPMIWWIASIVVILDQLAKWWAVEFLAPRDGPFIVLQNFLWLRFSENDGAMAGILGGQTIFLALLSVGALVILAIWSRSLPPGDWLSRIAFGGVIGGAVGNLCDRIFRGGYVVDFIDAHWYDRYHWLTFNLADSAISVGIALILFAQFRDYRREKAAEEAKGEAAREKGKTPAIGGTSD